MLAGTTITIAGCESDSPTAPSDSTPPGEASVSTSISANHGHGVIITVDQLSGGMLTLDIQGASTHPHTVELSMGSLQSIAAGRRVSVDSSFYSFHTHNVTFELI